MKDGNSFQGGGLSGAKGCRSFVGDAGECWSQTLLRNCGRCSDPSLTRYAATARLSSSACGPKSTACSPLSLPAHVPLHTAVSYTLSMAKQVWNGGMDNVIKTIERNVRLI